MPQTWPTILLKSNSNTKEMQPAILSNVKLSQGAVALNLYCGIIWSTMYHGIFVSIKISPQKLLKGYSTDMASAW